MHESADSSTKLQKILSIADLMRRTGQSRKTINRWIDDGYLEELPRPTGGHRKVSEAALEAFLSGDTAA